MGKVINIDEKEKRAKNRSLRNTKKNIKESTRHTIYYDKLLAIR